MNLIKKFYDIVLRTIENCGKISNEDFIFLGSDFELKELDGVLYIVQSNGRDNIIFGIVKDPEPGYDLWRYSTGSYWYFRDKTSVYQDGDIYALLDLQDSSYMFNLSLGTFNDTKLITLSTLNTFEIPENYSYLYYNPTIELRV